MLHVFAEHLKETFAIKCHQLACMSDITWVFFNNSQLYYFFQADPFHTLFGIAGLSLLDYGSDIKEVNPVFCMPEYVIQKLKNKPEIL